MAKKRRFDFTKKNKRSGKVENVGYLDLEQDEEQSRCSLYFYGDIVSATWESMWFEEDRCPQDIADFLNQLDGYEDIDIYFNSGGGDVFAGLAIYNQLKRYSGHKVGYVDGMAASIASVIMFACDELHFATGAQAMIHKPLCMAWGNADDFKEVIKQLDLCEDSILDVYEEHLKEGVTRDKIKSFMAKEKWFSGAELAEYFDVLIDERQQSQRVHQIILKNTTMFRRASKEQPQRTLSMRCLRNWRTGTMQQRQRNRESRQKSRIFLQTSTCMEFKKERT
jgi:ATP-dependent protease ClpP protease subunit